MTLSSMPDSSDATTMAYERRLIKPQAATGYFMPVPQDEPEFAVTLAYLHDHPNDVYMHRYGLQQVLAMVLDQVRELADYSSGDMTADLHRLETLLAANHLYPVYVDLTRRDLTIPVIRALVPGLELMADFDRYARVNPRLYRTIFNLLRILILRLAETHLKPREVTPPSLEKGLRNAVKLLCLF